MRILVAIACYGTKNLRFQETLLQEYRSMPFDIDVVVLSEEPKELGPDIEVQVGLPTPEPRSLPFAHRMLFAQRVDEYDLFIYSEDDTRLQAHHINAFLEASAVLPDDELPGFLRYELDPSGTRSYSSMHSGYHWDPASVRVRGGLTFARFSNDHGACYLLTRNQLRRAIESGGFLVEPHQRRESMMVAAATDPYTQCGFTRLVCLSRLDDFVVHHLPNVYLGKMGASQEDFDLQVEALRQAQHGALDTRRLFVTETKLPTVLWDKSYWEHPLTEVGAFAPAGATRVLSVGCGSGDAERSIFGPDAAIKAIPLDAVIAAVASTRGIDILRPNFADAFAQLENQTFDCVFVLNVLQHLPDPVAILSRLRAFLEPEGQLLAVVPNFRRERLKSLLGRSGKAHPTGEPFSQTRLHTTDRPLLKRWLPASGFTVQRVAYLQDRGVSVPGPAVRLISGWTAEGVLVEASALPPPVPQADDGTAQRTPATS